MNVRALKWIQLEVNHIKKLAYAILIKFLFCFLKKNHADAIILMQVMVSTALGAVPLTHQAFLLPLASLRAEITQSKRSTLSALVKASTSMVRRSTSCLKTHNGAWISTGGEFTQTAWGYFRMAVQMRQCGPEWKLQDHLKERSCRCRTGQLTHNPTQWLFACTGTLKTLKKLYVYVVSIGRNYKTVYIFEM